MAVCSLTRFPHCVHFLDGGLFLIELFASIILQVARFLLSLCRENYSMHDLCVFVKIELRITTLRNANILC
jgi:hypothetical protein